MRFHCHFWLCILFLLSILGNYCADSKHQQPYFPIFHYQSAEICENIRNGTEQIRVIGIYSDRSNRMAIITDKGNMLTMNRRQFKFIEKDVYEIQIPVDSSTTVTVEKVTDRWKGVNFGLGKSRQENIFFMLRIAGASYFGQIDRKENKLTLHRFKKNLVKKPIVKVLGGLENIHTVMSAMGYVRAFNVHCSNGRNMCVQATIELAEGLKSANVNFAKDDCTEKCLPNPQPVQPSSDEPLKGAPLSAFYDRYHGVAVFFYEAGQVRLFPSFTHNSTEYSQQVESTIKEFIQCGDDPFWEKYIDLIVGTVLLLMVALLSALYCRKQIRRRNYRAMAAHKGKVSMLGAPLSSVDSCPRKLNKASKASINSRLDSIRRNQVKGNKLANRAKEKKQKQKKHRILPHSTSPASSVASAAGSMVSTSKPAKRKQ